MIRFLPFLLLPFVAALGAHASGDLRGRLSLTQLFCLFLSCNACTALWLMAVRGPVRLPVASLLFCLLYEFAYFALLVRHECLTAAQWSGAGLALVAVVLLTLGGGR